MPTYGLTNEGLVIKSLEVIREEMNTALRTKFGQSIDLGERSIFGQIVGILAEREALIWELAEAVNSAQDPDKATGAALDAICTLTGTFRPPASFSTVVGTLTGTPATVVPSGSQASLESNGNRFETLEDATIEAATAWMSSTAYLEDARVTNSGNIYQCITAGTSDVSGGPTLGADDAGNDDITDGTAHWMFVGVGTGVVDTTFQATETGEIEALAGDLNTIETRISGWNNVINLEDAEKGREVATDQELRILREQELGGLGSSHVDALRARLLRLTGVTAATVFQNDTDTTDADGMPPHSVEALVRGPSSPTEEFDQSIRDTLLASVAAGIQTHGTVSGTATDSQEIEHTIKFSRPDEIDIYVLIGVVKDDEYPEDGDKLIKSAIVDWGALQATGKDAVPSQIAANVHEVAGVLEVSYVGLSTSAIATPTEWAALTAYNIGNVVTNSGRVYRCTGAGTSAASGGPTSTSSSITDGTATWEYISGKISISLRQLATYDSSRITVVSTDGVA